MFLFILHVCGSKLRESLRAKYHRRLERQQLDFELERTNLLRMVRQECNDILKEAREIFLQRQELKGILRESVSESNADQKLRTSHVYPEMLSPEDTMKLLQGILCKGGQAILEDLDRSIAESMGRLQQRSGETWPVVSNQQSSASATTHPSETSQQQSLPVTMQLSFTVSPPRRAERTENSARVNLGTILDSEQSNARESMGRSSKDRSQQREVRDFQSRGVSVYPATVTESPQQQPQARINRRRDHDRAKAKREAFASQDAITRAGEREVPSVLEEGAAYDKESSLNVSHKKSSRRVNTST